MEPITPKDTNPKFNGNGSYGSSFGGPVDTNIERESWKDMAQNLYTDINRLWSKESQLIRTEMNEKVSDIKVAATSLATGGAVLLVGLFAAVATAIIVLDLFMQLWVSSLIVTGVLLIAGFVMLKGAQKKLEADKLKPKHSIDAFGEIKNTFQERIHEFKKH